jgi:Domain of unknown function (DUF4954)
MDLYGMTLPVEKLLARFHADLQASTFMASMREVHQMPQRLQSGRPLTREETAQLQAQGNTAEHWDAIRVLGEGDLSAVRGNHFAGEVTFHVPTGNFTDARGRVWQAGIRNSTLRNCCLGQACIDSVGRLENMVVEDEAIVAHCALITCAAGQCFSLGVAIHPGDETGSRSLWLWDGLDLTACESAIGLSPQEQKTFQIEIDSRLASARSDFGFIGPGAHILACSQIENTWIGPGARLESALLVRGCAMLSQADRPVRLGPGARAVDCLLQAGTEITDGGSALRSVLLEASGIGESGKVSESVLGPNTHVEKGEITASLVGPFVGFHHQALLIAALWPEGRGNVGYGANVGSNHTGKKPDQEIRPGEGLFFGLGCTIKFPADFRDAPYSLIASGAVTLPQRVRYPFSLIMPPTFAPTDETQGLNEIRPGFMWGENLYALARNRFKFKDRDKSRNHSLEPVPLENVQVRDGFFSGGLFDAPLSIKVAAAYQHLSPFAAGTQEFLLPSALSSLGKNVLRTSYVPQALQAYREYLQLVLVRWGVEPAIWQYAALREEKCGPALRALGIPVHSPWRDQLTLYRPLLQSLPNSVAQSLQRDHRRGQHILDDYASFHGAASEESVVKRMQQSVQALDALL